jgi:thioredoxin 1
MKFYILISSAFVITSIYSQNQLDTTTYVQLSSLEFSEIIQSKEGILLDVRTKGEFNAEHIEGAGQLNYYAFDFKKKLEMLPKDQAIWLYCNTGYRSERAAKHLIKKGYTQVYNLEHGIMEWNFHNLPVIEGDRSLLDQENMVSVSEFNKLIKSDSLVFIDFYAPWCAPCRKMMPMIDSLKTEFHQEVKIVKVNADASKKLVKEMKLIGVPYFVLYKNNVKLKELSGTLKREEILALFQEYR